jgi:hypothetical protein
MLLFAYGDVAFGHVRIECAFTGSTLPGIDLMTVAALRLRLFLEVDRGSTRD